VQQAREQQTREQQELAQQQRDSEQQRAARDAAAATEQKARTLANRLAEQQEHERRIAEQEEARMDDFNRAFQPLEKLKAITPSELAAVYKLAHGVWELLDDSEQARLEWIMQDLHARCSL
jgi:hypothetical protein